MEGGDYMIKHFLEVLGSVLYPFFIGYMIFIEISYFYLKTLKKDKRFENVGFFKYFESPIKTLKGDK